MASNTKNEIWVIAYINREFIDRASMELVDYGYHDIQAYIPTVRVLRKKFKGKQMFEFVPLLFNYGFFKMPYKYACNPEKLMEIRNRITAIYAWMKDYNSTVTDTPRLNERNSNFIDAIPRAAIATDEEIARLVKATQSMSIYSQEDLQQFKPGDIIKLEGYPFDNMPAEIIHINHNRKEVKVKLLLDAIVKEVTVSFENVFYSIYKDFSENTNDISSDEMEEKYGPNAVDNLTWKRHI